MILSGRQTRGGALRTSANALRLEKAGLSSRSLLRACFAPWAMFGQSGGWDDIGVPGRRQKIEADFTVPRSKIGAETRRFLPALSKSSPTPPKCAAELCCRSASCPTRGRESPPIQVGERHRRPTPLCQKATLPSTVLKVRQKNGSARLMAAITSGGVLGHEHTSRQLKVGGKLRLWGAWDFERYGSTRRRRSTGNHERSDAAICIA